MARDFLRSACSGSEGRPTELFLDFLVQPRSPRIGLPPMVRNRSNGRLRTAEFSGLRLHRAGHDDRTRTR